MKAGPGGGPSFRPRTTCADCNCGLRTVDCRLRPMSDATAAPAASRTTSAAQGPPSGRVRPRMADFLRICAILGSTGFGGGLAILSQAGEVFEKKRWLTDREWVHTATVAQLLPGGAATNALAYVGLRFYGWLGAAAAV